MARISVIVPVYNGERYLEECLDSIAGQSFADFEAIVVNDGSIDGTEGIILKFCNKDNRFRYLKTENEGVSSARNMGIDNAGGDYLTFVDADDCLQPEALERMLELAEGNGAEVCICSFTQGDIFSPSPIEKECPEIYSYPKAMKRALYQSRIMNSAWGALFARSLLKPNIRFRVGIRYEDLDAFYRFYEKAEKIVYTREPLYFYRKNKDGFIRNWSIERLDALDVTDRIEEYVTERYPSLKGAARDRRFSAHFNIMMLLISNNIEDGPAIERCFKIIKRYRLRTLLDPHVRVKNKIGALLSFGGVEFIKRLAQGESSGAGGDTK